MLSVVAVLAAGRATPDTALFGGLTVLLVLAALYGLTVLFTEMITNNAAAILVFPLAVDAASTMEVSPLPFAVAVMVAASASFATPIGYQTNLMVMGPGGYRFTDYTRIGLPLGLLIGAVTVGLVPLVWPFG